MFALSLTLIPHLIYVTCGEKDGGGRSIVLQATILKLLLNIHWLYKDCKIEFLVIICVSEYGTKAHSKLLIEFWQLIKRTFTVNLTCICFGRLKCQLAPVLSFLIALIIFILFINFRQKWNFSFWNTILFFICTCAPYPGNYVTII